MRTQRCRICKSEDIKLFLKLGDHPLADAFIEASRLKEEEVCVPLEVCACQECGLIQLNYTVPASQLYDKNYIYESSITQMGQKHWTEFSTTAAEIADLKTEELVVDIGSNVGVLLKNFRDRGAKVLGVDPAPTIAKLANERGIETIESFFDFKTANQIKKEKSSAKIITATNVFAHIDDLHMLMRAVDFLLAKHGIFIIEAPYILNLIKSLEYDTIYHEHLSYLSLKPMIILFNKFDMEIFEVQQRDIHGGSIRCYVRRKQNSISNISNIITDLLELEYRSGIYELSYLKKFAIKVSSHRKKLMTLLQGLKDDGRIIAGVSAPAKGMTLINYCGIGPDILEFITEKSTLKIGRYTPGQRIPIVPDKKLLELQPDYALILAWNFSEEIMENLNDYLLAGGKFIIPIPEPRILG